MHFWCSLGQRFCFNLPSDLSHYFPDVLMLPREATHYIVPDCQVSKDFLELFEQPEVQGVVFTQTAANCVGIDVCHF